MSNAAELKTNRRNTAIFIDINPIVITLTPQRRVRTATGGFETANDPPRPPQTFRIIDLTTGYATVRDPVQRTIDGIERSIEFMILGNWDAVIARFDTWTADGNRWEVTQLYPDNGYEQRAVVARYGDPVVP